MIDLRSATTDELSADDVAALRALFKAAWPAGDFDDDDLAHAMGGRHWLLSVDGRAASLVLATLTWPLLDLATSISCEWRRGDSW